MTGAEVLRYTQATFTKDLLASLVVFLVALPLCMGISLACGLPPAAGLISGIVGGIVVGRLSGCPLLVSGPAAGLTVIVYDIFQKYGFEGLGTIVVLSGIMQTSAGLLKAGQWFRAVSPAVINGMLAGIGILIIGSQFHVMLDAKPKGSGINNLLSIPQALWDCIQCIEVTHTHVAGGIGVLTIVILILWAAGMPKKFQLLPASLIAIGGATVLTCILGLEINKVQVPENFLTAIRFPSFNSALLLNPQIWVEAVALAFIASAETLLSAVAVDKMHTGPRSNYDRELLAQGIGNTICGALGALPITGVIVRSSVNVQSGARTRMSAILHGIWLLLAVVLFANIIRMIPTAALAALLVYTGYKLVNIKAAKELLKFGKLELAIYLITIATIVTEDLLTGVLVGFVLSALKIAYLFSHLDIRIEIDDELERTNMHLHGSATFLSLPRLATALDEVPADTELHVHFEELDYIDHACLDLLMNWENQHKAQGGHLVIDWGTLGAMFRERRRSLGRGGPTAGTTVQIDDSDGVANDPTVKITATLLKPGSAGESCSTDSPESTAPTPAVASKAESESLH